MIADCQSALARTLELEANVPCGFVTCEPMLSARSISSLVGRAQLHDFNRPRASSFPKAATSKRLPYTWNLLGAWQHLGILAFSFRRVCFSNMTKRAKTNPTTTSFTSWTCSLRKCKEPICDSDARVEVAISLKGEATSTGKMEPQWLSTDFAGNLCFKNVPRQGQGANVRASC